MLEIKRGRCINRAKGSMADKVRVVNVRLTALTVGSHDTPAKAGQDRNNYRAHFPLVLKCKAGYSAGSPLSLSLSLSLTHTHTFSPPLSLSLPPPLYSAPVLSLPCICWFLYISFFCCHCFFRLLFQSAFF